MLSVVGCSTLVVGVKISPYYTLSIDFINGSAFCSTGSRIFLYFNIHRRIMIICICVFLYCFRQTH